MFNLVAYLDTVMFAASEVLYNLNALDFNFKGLCEQLIALTSQQWSLLDS
jgi:hypothetical protein